jgi:hypothetical protein
MGANDPVGVLPHLRHGVEVARLEGGVEGPVGGEDAVEISDPATLTGRCSVT